MTAPATATWRALGTTAELRVTDGTRLEAALDAVRRELEAIDLACSRFRDDSELLALREAAGRPVRVSPLLAEAITIALDAARRSGGAVDPTIGSTIRTLGWDEDFELVRRRHDVPRVRVERVAGWRSVRIDPGTGVVHVPAGVELDLGSVGKAWAADRCARAAAAAIDGCGVLVSLGGDIAVAGASPATGWRIRVGEDHASAPRADDSVIALHSGAIATSSTAVRRWHGRRSGDHAELLHHVIDPRTGAPADSPWRTVSAAARTCALANTASLAAIVLGHDAVEWLTRVGVPARLVPTDGGAPVTVGPWPTRTHRVSHEAVAR